MNAKREGFLVAGNELCADGAGIHFHFQNQIFS